MNDMSKKELYQKKMQARLDEWKAEIDVLKARASQASTDLQMEMHEHITELEDRMDAARVKLSSLAEASEDNWESLKVDIEARWESLKIRVRGLVDKFRG